MLHPPQAAIATLPCLLELDGAKTSCVQLLDCDGPRLTNSSHRHVLEAQCSAHVLYIWDRRLVPCCICLNQALDVGNKQPGKDRLLLQQCHSLIIQGFLDRGQRFSHRSDEESEGSKLACHAITLFTEEGRRAKGEVG